MTRPPGFQFQPGQRLRFVHGDIERDYSPISTPRDHTITLYVGFKEDGILTPVLASARMGTRFDLTGPYGYFTYQSTERPAIFVATGTGIAPFVSMARSGVTGFSLLHGVRVPEDLHYRFFFQKMTMNYVACLSGKGTEIPSDDGAFQGRVTDFLIKGLAPDVYDFYVCGSGEMIKDVTHIVYDRFPGSLVYTENFF